MKTWKDKNGTKIKEPGNLRFSMEDEQEISGYSTFEAPVKITQSFLGYFSPIEKRVIPFMESYNNGIVDNAEVI